MQSAAAGTVRATAVGLHGGAGAGALARLVGPRLRTHPFQIAYWNVFAGGPGGAIERRLPQSGDYWGMSYRLGMGWLSENAERDAFVAVPVVEHAVRLTAQEHLRDDLFLLPVSTPFSPRIAPERLQKTLHLARERPVYVMFVPRLDWMNELMALSLSSGEPAAVWELDGAPILYVFRLGPAPRLESAP